jgi:hypothetical protein
VDHITRYHCWKKPAWKDPMVEIKCIPPQHNMWYRVACISGIRVSLVVFSWWHKQNTWFLYFIFFISLWWYGQIFSFSKMKISISNFKNNLPIFFKNFLTAQTKYFKFFHFSLVVWLILFKFQNKNFHFKFQNESSNFFHFPIMVWPIVFKIFMVV